MHIAPLAWVPPDAVTAFQPPALAPHTIVTFGTAAAPALAAGWLHALPHAERARAQTLQRPADRARFVAGRTLARQVLAAWQGDAPGTVPLRHTRRPMLPPGWPWLSIAHARALAVVAVCASAPVGVDVEWLGRQARWTALRTRCLSAAEQRAMDAHAAPGAGFLHQWVRKEAVLKAAGGGIAGDLRAVDTHAEPVRVPGCQPAYRVGAVTTPHGFDYAVAVAWRD